MRAAQEWLDIEHDAEWQPYFERWLDEAAGLPVG